MSSLPSWPLSGQLGLGQNCRWMGVPHIEVNPVRASPVRMAAGHAIESGPTQVVNSSWREQRMPRDCCQVERPSERQQHLKAEAPARRLYEGLLTRFYSRHILRDIVGEYVLTPARSVFLCTGRFSLLQSDRGSSLAGMIAVSGAPLIHAVCYASVLAACCCIHGPASVFAGPVADAAATSCSDLSLAPAHATTYLSSHDNECRPCGGPSHLFAARPDVRWAKRLAPLSALRQPSSSLSDRLGASSLARASSPSEPAGADLRMLRVTVLLI